MVSCPGCGQSMRFDPGKGVLVCDYCDSQLNPGDASSGSQALGYTEQADATLEGDMQALASESTPATISGTLYTCPQCGGEIFCDSDTAVTFCSYCGVSVELQGRTVQMQAPSYVIPFKKTKDQCKELYKQFIKKAMFAPNYLKEEGQLEKLRGIYMPYWVYELSYEGPVSFKGKKSYRRGDYIITDHYSLTSDMSIYYKGASFDASSSFSDVYSEAIAPFNVQGSIDFSDVYLAGFYADTADVKADVYEQNAKNVVGSDVIAGMYKMYPEFARYNVSTSDNTMSQLLNVKDSKLAYFPVWFMSVRHNNRISYAVINGETGKIAADVPIDYKKYLIGSLILTIPLALILNLLFTPTPKVVGIVASIFALIGCIIASKELDLVYTRQHGFDDKGLMSTRDMTIPVQNTSGNSDSTKKEASTRSALGSIGGVLMFIGAIALYAAIEAEIAAPAGIGCILLVLGLILSGLSTANKSKPKPATNQVVFKRPFGEKIGTLWKSLAAMVIGIGVTLINPYRDEIYYGCVLAVVVLVLLALFDIVKLHNELTTHLPRQFNKRGGDE